jgi:hypothetical protein
MGAKEEVREGSIALPDLSGFTFEAKALERRDI